jgi:hypothetical protein
MAVEAETNNGDVTSWIPLTSTFTPSSGCESIFRLNGPSLVAFDPGYGIDIDENVKCVPSAVTTWWEQARLGVGGDDHTALSIQPLICPDLWTTVATYVKDTFTTQIMCCPSQVNRFPLFNVMANLPTEVTPISMPRAAPLTATVYPLYPKAWS